MNSVADSIIGDIRAMADPERARVVSRYMKTSSLRFLGVGVTEVRRLTRASIRNLTPDDFPSLMNDLWFHRIFECRIAAITAMDLYTTRGDTATAFEMISSWIDDADTWSIIDPLCTVSLGNLIIRDGALEDRIEDWRGSDNVWRRRAAVLPYLHLSKKTFHRPEYNERILNAMASHIGDSAFFVAKAVGWVLRELSRRAPEVVTLFIESNRGRMHSVTVREASRMLVEKTQ